ncbi:MAG TPA: hypothetical protein VLK82_02685 [Candidatus Tectomicrobia bacterium]|nr:hypothetical protein [Candidatus Tectomicrobia bacterium]
MKPTVAIMVILMGVMYSTLGWAGSGAQESTPEQIGAGVGSVVGSAVYFPFKASFCILGGIASGVTLVADGPESANKVASAACRGTWAITPDIVKGQTPVNFVGNPPAPTKAQRRSR